MTPISATQLHTLLSISDLTDNPHHAVALMAHEIEQRLKPIAPPIQWVKGLPIVSVDHNYRLLGYADDDITQADRYTKWVDERHVLRTQTTSLIVGQLLAQSPLPHAMTMLAPGMVYRRDVRDRWHCGEPHQMDIWSVYPKQSAWDTPDALHRWIDAVMGALNAPYECSPTSHSYTQGGQEINASWEGRMLEVGECGQIDPHLLQRLGWDAAQWTGIAMGVGLDRMVMARKQLPDIRLLRDPLAACARQMSNLNPWQSISRQPSAQRDLSLIRLHQDDEEHLTEHALEAAGMHQHWVEEVSIVEQWPVHQLPAVAQDRLGAPKNSYNVLMRVVLRDVGQSIERKQANEVLRRIYRALHQGHQWTYCP